MDEKSNDELRDELNALLKKFKLVEKDDSGNITLHIHLGCVCKVDNLKSFKLIYR